MQIKNIKCDNQKMNERRSIEVIKNGLPKKSPRSSAMIKKGFPKKSPYPSTVIENGCLKKLACSLAMLKKWLSKEISSLSTSSYDPSNVQKDL